MWEVPKAFRVIPEYKFADEDILIRLLDFYDDERIFADGLVPSLRLKLSNLSEFMRRFDTFFIRKNNAKKELPNSVDLFRSPQYFIGSYQIRIFNNGGRADDSISRIFVGSGKQIGRQFGDLWTDAFKWEIQHHRQSQFF